MPRSHSMQRNQHDALDAHDQVGLSDHIGDLCQLDTGEAVDDLDNLVNANSLDALESALGGCRDANGVLVDEYDLVAIEGQRGLQFLDEDTDEAQHATDDAVVSTRLQALSVTDIEDSRAAIERFSLTGGLDTNAHKISTLCMQLAESRTEYAHFMTVMGDKVEPPVPLSDLEVFLVHETKRRVNEEGARDGTELRSQLTKEWMATSLKPLPFPQVHLPVSIECGDVGASLVASAIPGRPRWAVGTSVVDKAKWHVTAKAHNASIGVTNEPTKLGIKWKRGRHTRGFKSTKPFKFPLARKRVAEGLKALKGLQLARKYATFGPPKEPKKPVEPKEPDEEDNKYKGVEGRKALGKAKTAYQENRVQYEKDAAMYKEDMVVYTRAVDIREKTLKNNKKSALKYIEYLGVHHPKRGLWMRASAPVRSRVDVTVKAPSFAEPVAVKEPTVIALRCANVEAAAANVTHRTFMDGQLAAERAAGFLAQDLLWRKGERDRTILDRAAQASFRADRAAKAALRSTHETTTVAAALALEKQQQRAIEQKAQAELDANIEKMLADAKEARKPLWLEEEKAANESGIKARDAKKERLDKMHKDRQDLKDLEAEELKAHHEAVKTAAGSVDRFLAHGRLLIIKAKQKAKLIKLRNVPKVKSRGVKGFFNIITNGNPATLAATSDAHMNETFEDVDEDVSVNVVSQRAPTKSAA